MKSLKSEPRNFDKFEQVLEKLCSLENTLLVKEVYLIITTNNNNSSAGQTWLEPIRFEYRSSVRMIVKIGLVGIVSQPSSARKIVNQPRTNGSNIFGSVRF